MFIGRQGYRREWLERFGEGEGSWGKLLLAMTRAHASRASPSLSARSPTTVIFSSACSLLELGNHS